MAARNVLSIASTCVLALVGWGTPLRTQAGIEDGGKGLTLAAFGTLSLVRTDHEGSHFLPYSAQPDGADHTWTADIDSILGIQVRYSLARSLSATLQLTSRRDESNNYLPDVDWAYFSYQPGHGTSIRLGRFVAPLFASSDTRLVGYANLWVRPPVDVYTLGISSVDGADLVSRQTWLGMSTMLQLWAGRSYQNYPRQSATGLLTNQAAAYDNLVGANWNVQLGAVAVRMAHLRARQTLITTRGEPESSLRTFGLSQRACMTQAAANGYPAMRCRDLYDGFAALESRYDVNRARFRFTSIGLDYEQHAWRVIAEAIWLRHDSRIADSRAGYLTVARSGESLTPYLTYSWHRAPAKAFSATVKPEHENLVRGNLATYRPAGSNGPQQRTVGLGLRWDPCAGLAFKAQVDRIRSIGNGNGTSGTNRAGLIGRNLSRQPALSVYSLSADFAY